MSDPRSLGSIDAWVPTPLTVDPTSAIFRLPGLMDGGNRASCFDEPMRLQGVGRVDVFDTHCTDY